MIKKIIYLAVMAGLFAGCVPDNQIYMLQGEQKSFTKLGWKVPTAKQNSGAARSFMSFVKEIRDEEWEKADAFLANGIKTKSVLHDYPCLKKDKIKVWDEDPGMQTRKTRLHIACGSVTFMADAIFVEELGWQFRFVHKVSTTNTKK